MKFYGDYHTHTTVSDGKSSLLENVLEAEKKGLLELAVTDHGFANPGWAALTPEKFDLQRKKITELQKEHPSLKLYHGIEADIVGLDGTVDLTEKQLREMDVILMGYHSFATPASNYDKYKLFRRTLAAFIFKPSKKVIARNTKAYIEAVKKYPIDILAHVNHLFKVNCLEVAKACADYGTMIELNIKHFNTLTPELFSQMASTGVKFIAGSDAHKAERVGNFEKIISFLEENGKQPEILENYGKLPFFPRKEERMK